MDSVKITAKKIREIKIQGASKIREKAFSSLVNASLESKAKTPLQFRNEFLKNALLLFNSRPTEPAMRTGIRILKKSISEKNLTIEQMKEQISITHKKYDKENDRALSKITSYGASTIKSGAVIMTLCHSQMVVNILKAARKKIKHVYCLETRPLFQGRVTAKELANAGIKVTLIIDNAASVFLKQCDYFFTGADAFLSDGDVINKIGTNQISTLCGRYDTKHFVACATHKFEPSTFFGKDEPIEFRESKEVISKKIPRVSVVNPAFDRTNSDLIEGIICEKGVFSPEILASKLYDDLNLDEHEVDFLKL